MRNTEESLRQYEDDMRRARLIVNIADEMKERGILSAAERREFLLKQAKKKSLDPSLLTR